MILSITFAIAVFAGCWLYIDDRRCGWKDPRYAVGVFFALWPWLIGAAELLRRLGRYILIAAGLR